MIASGGWYTPSSAIVEYALDMSSGETRPVPRMIEGTTGRWSECGIPSR